MPTWSRGIIWLLVLTWLAACNPAADQATSVASPTRTPADERAKGDPNAPVTLIEYGDYQ